MKKITIATAQVYGATEVDAAIEAMKGAKSIYRSDVLDNLADAVTTANVKLMIDADKIKVNPPVDAVDTIKGYDSDHPFVTKELPAKKSEGTSEIFRAWRYVAIVS